VLFQFQIKIASILSGIGIAHARAGAKTVGFARSRRALSACGSPNKIEYFIWNPN
jgi:hypothetical protein